MLAWQTTTLHVIAKQWFDSIHRKTSQLAGENSLWWTFLYHFPKQFARWIDDFQYGAYCFSPMTQYHFFGETIRAWCYRDRMMLKLILSIIKTTFKHIVPKRCYHMQGPSGVSAATEAITRALKHGDFRYVIRADIKGYYASISRKILLKQLKRHFQDPRLIHYFDQIVNCAVDKNADIFVQKYGIPRRSSLSPFFGALYLAELDLAFEGCEGVQYYRYMDDIIILAKTKRQFKRAKKILYLILNKLELKLSPTKTKMGRLDNSFHFLGVLFEVTRIPQTKTMVSVRIHPRTCARALDRLKAMRNNIRKQLPVLKPAVRQRLIEPVKHQAFLTELLC